MSDLPRPIWEHSVVDNDDPGDPQSQIIEIQLDSNGDGSANWTVPQWRVACFNAPDVAEEVRYID